MCIVLLLLRKIISTTRCQAYPSSTALSPRLIHHIPHDSRLREHRQPLIILRAETRDSLMKLSLITSQHSSYISEEPVEYGELVQDE